MTNRYLNLKFWLYGSIFFLAVGLFLQVFFIWNIASNTWFSITQFYCFNSMMILENNSGKSKYSAIDATEVLQMWHEVKIMSYP